MLRSWIGGRTSRVKWSSPLASLEVLPLFPKDKGSAGSDEGSWGGADLPTESASADISIYRPLSAAAQSGSVVVGCTYFAFCPRVESCINPALGVSVCVMSVSIAELSPALLQIQCMQKCVIQSVTNRD